MAKALTARVLKATSLIGSTQGINMVCSIVRMKMLALLVGPTGVGLFGALTQAADMIGNFTQLNIRTSAVAPLSSASAERFGPLLLSVRRYSRMLGLVGAALMFILAPFIAEFTFGDAEFAWAYRLASLSILFVALQGAELIYLQSTQRYKPIAASGLLTALTGLPVAIALYWLLNINGVAPGLVFYSVVAFGGAWWFSRRSEGALPPLRQSSISWRESLRMGFPFLRTGLMLTLMSLATEGVNFLFVSFMGHEGETVLGLYQAGYKMVWNYTAVFFMSFTMEFYPRVSKTIHNRRHASLIISHQAIITSGILVLGSVAICALSPWLMPLLYSREFADAVPYVMWGMVGMAFRPLSITMSYSFLAAGRSKVYCTTEVLSALCGLVLNVIGYRLGGFAGLGLGTTAWMALDLTIMLVAARLSDAPFPKSRAILIAYLSPLPAALLSLLLQ